MTELSSALAAGEAFLARTEHGNSLMAPRALNEVRSVVANLLEMLREANPLEQRLAYLARLKPNWDSYGAVPITPEAVAAVRRWVHDLQITPRANGGVQIELSAAGFESDLPFGPLGEEE